MAMFAVSMTDGGGGKKAAPAKQSIFAKAAAAVKEAVAKVQKGIAAFATSVAEAQKKKAAAEAAAKKPAAQRQQQAAQPQAQPQAQPEAPKASAENIIEWNGVKFYVKPNEIRSFKAFSLSTSCETEDEENGGEKYAKKKNSGGYEAKLTAIFDRRLGTADVKGPALELCEMGRNGGQGYLYHKGGKLITPMMMATSATANNWTFAPDGSVLSVDVDITLKQCSKYGGGTSPGADKPTGGGNSGPWTYKVQISGMSMLTISAYSVQQAITKAAGSNYEGFITVNGKQYYIHKGKFDNNYAKHAMSEEPKTQQAAQTAKEQSIVAKAKAKIQEAKKALPKPVATKKPVALLK